MDPRVAAGNRCRSTMGADVAAALGGSGCCGLVLPRQAAMARSAHRILSALADRCRAVGFVFAASGCDCRFLFFVAQLPVLGLIDNFIFRYSLVFDHLQYLASMGPLALAGAGFARASDIVLQKRPLLQSAPCVGLLLILGMASWQRTWVYRSQETLWSDTLPKNPDSWMAHNNLGVAFFQRGKLDDALAQFQKALEINPNYAEAHTNLGIALLQKGQLGKAIEQHQTALKINPNFALAHANLAVAFIRKGRIDDAIAEFQEALRLDANLSAVRETLEKVKAFESKK